MLFLSLKNLCILVTHIGTLTVEDGDFIWCFHACPDMGRDIEVLSVASPSHASEEEVVGPTVPDMAARLN